VPEHEDEIQISAEVGEGPPITGDPALLGQLVDTAIGVLVAGSAADAEIHVRAGPADGLWRLEVSTSAAGAATSERLLSTRLPHPDAPGEQRTGALALMLARAIAARHDGALSLALASPGASITVTLPVQPDLTDTQP